MADTITSSNELNLDTAYLDGDTRRIKVTNPKTQTDEAWKTQINDLSDYIAQNQLLLGDKGGAQFDKITKATLTQKEIHKLDISGSAPIYISPTRIETTLANFKNGVTFTISNGTPTFTVQGGIGYTTGSQQAHSVDLSAFTITQTTTTITITASTFANYNIRIIFTISDSANNVVFAEVVVTSNE